jgi:hypothetical protein
MKIPKLLFLHLILCFSGIYAQSQVPMKELPLNDLSGFRATPGNWQIAGDVTMDRNVDIHQHPEPTPATGKKGKKTAGSSFVNPVQITSGKGVLVNYFSEEVTKNLKAASDAKDWAKIASYNLVTTWEHGDIELELEVMLPKGSNSGIYLQGRYEVQLFDSWGEKTAKYSDLGGIYRNWESEPSKIYLGKAPTANAAKAPGLWQKMYISFTAPRFNQKGEKIANARINKVIINGLTVHDNVEIPLPTGGPIENNEKPTGPLMIQGDHGAVAFRNIKYRLLKNERVTLSNINYSYYEGKFSKIADFVSSAAKKSGKTPELSWEVIEKPDEYGVTYSGKINVPEDADYFFSLKMNGGGRLMIDNENIIDFEGSHYYGETGKGKINLSAGSHNFVLFYYKAVGWQKPILGLFAESENLPIHALHTINSFLPESDEPTDPILIQVQSEPRLIRAFLDFKGDYSQRRTHTIAVGEPSGIHYIYDLKAGSLLCVWKGEFIDATPMWHDRGDGSYNPMGSVQYLFTSPSLLVLDNPSANWIIENTTDYRSKGYILEESTGRPAFKYLYKGMEIEDKTYPEDGNKIFTREITLKNGTKASNLFVKLAEGKIITELTDGTFAVDDKQYYIKPLSGKAQIREVNGKKELIAPFDGTSIKYSIIW